MNKTINSLNCNKFIYTNIQSSSIQVTINQSANQTIFVTCNGESYTDSFKAKRGSSYTVTIVANEGYNAGTLSSTSGTITEPITISATVATLKT